KSERKINLPAKKIEVVDNRYDDSKQGFYPVYKSPPKLIEFGQPLSEWFYSQLENSINLQNDSARKLVFVIQKFWFGNSADQHFTPFKQNLDISLIYRIELFSAINENYYPLKRIEGHFTTHFSELDCYIQLVDSLFTT